MAEAEQNVPTVDQIDAVIEQWFFESFHGSLIAQSTAVWNAVHAAKDDLKHRMSGLLDQPHTP